MPHLEEHPTPAMADREPIETTNLAPERSEPIAWSRLRDRLAAPPPPNTPGGHFVSFLGTIRRDGRPHATGVGARWHDGDLYFLSGPDTLKARNLAANPACTISMKVDGLDVVFDGEASLVEDQATLDAVGAVVRTAGWPVEESGGQFTAPFGPDNDKGPPWRLYRFTFHTAIGQGDEGATRWRFTG